MLTIKLGVVTTALTAEIDLPAKLSVSADHAAADIARAVKKEKEIRYTPYY